MTFAIAVHGGASSGSIYLQQHVKEYEEGLAEAVQAGFDLLKNGHSALNAVEASVKILEDNPLFNAGRGSALNNNGEVEMDASIMDGSNLKAGAAAIVRNVKNPILLARHIMEKTDHVLLAGPDALNFAKSEGISLKPDSYFITEQQYNIYQQHLLNRHQKRYGTVGCVALDKNGNLAAGTSTGGLNNALPGRVGDSCIIGAGCYANNQSCAVSGTGEGEYLIRGVVAHSIAMKTEWNRELKKACEEVVHTHNKQLQGEVGVIAVNRKGEVCAVFNTEVMKRAWMREGEELQVRIYK